MIPRIWLWLGILSAFVLPIEAQDVRTEKPREWRQPGTPPVYTGEVTVAFWNLEWFPGGQTSREYLPPSHLSNHIAAVAGILNAENPVILIAAEVRDLESALALNRALQQPYPFVAVTDYGNVNTPGKEGKFNYQEHALFSRIPWTEMWEVDFGALPVTPTRPTRGFIGATFVVGKQPLTVYGVHPKSNYIRQGEKKPELTALRNTEKRERASELLLEDLRGRKLDPLKDRVIIAGDFNTDVYAERFQGDKSVKMILQAGFFNNLDSLTSEARVTIPSQKDDTGKVWPDSTFDYILSSVGLGKLPASVVQRGVDKSEKSEPGKPGHASDHYMVKMQLPAM